MINLRKGVIALIWLALICGCAKAPAPDLAAKEPASKGASASQDAAAPSEDEEEAPAPPQGDVSTIPASLKHDGYAYFGLDNAKPQDMEMRSQGVSGTPELSTGSVHTVFTAMKDGVAHFTTTRTGALEQFGETDDITCEPSGVYTVSTSAGKIGSKHLELPATLAKGSTWHVKTSMTTSEGHKIEAEDSFVARGIVPVKTKMGNYEALFVESNGTAIFDGKRARTETKGWYVRGRGQVRIEITTTSGGKSQTITLEESKPSSNK